MLTETLNNHHHDEHHHHDDGSKVMFGFWIYIMSDCILFASLFATFASLHNNTYGGHAAKQIFNLPFVLTETFILLTSSFSYGLAILAANKGYKGLVLFCLFITFILGASFVSLELWEFHHLYLDGDSWQRSAFLSSFFTLVGTHGLHVTIGLLWMAVLFFQVIKHGITSVTKLKILKLSLFWHFLDLVWIFVFSIVYLMGAI